MGDFGFSINKSRGHGRTFVLGVGGYHSVLLGFNSSLLPATNQPTNQPLFIPVDWFAFAKHKRNHLVFQKLTFFSYCGIIHIYKIYHLDHF